MMGLWPCTACGTTDYTVGVITEYHLRSDLVKMKLCDI